MYDFNLFHICAIPGLFSLSRQKDFFYVPETKTWQDAQTYCREMYTDLATIENIHEYEKARGNVDKLYLGNVWIGLKKEVDIHWGWALGENTLSQFSLWAQNQPDNGFLDGHCGAMDQGSHWYAINCLSNNNFICYNELDGKFYYYFRALVTWKAAQSYCRMYHTDLASIRNSNESSRVSSFSLTPGYVWLGLFADSWSWSDHSSSSFRYWGVENKVTPLNYSVCAVMDMNDLGLWKSLICDTKLPFLCYKGKCLCVWLIYSTLLLYMLN
ncbi:hypothetical protein NFI96_014760 [Prochilodus magdalenae]|nr:hypothetical protein NFI96_014760 [Prochilodus magdalenae]